MTNKYNLEDNRNFKGIWIPKEIWFSRKLTMQEKLFLIEIDSLNNKDGCFASNGWFAEFFQLSNNRVSGIINNLIKKGYINSKLIYKKGSKEVEKRILSLCYELKFVFKKENSNTPLPKTVIPPPVNSEDIIIVYNNKDNNNKDNNNILKGHTKEIIKEDVRLQVLYNSDQASSEKEKKIISTERSEKNILISSLVEVNKDLNNNNNNFSSSLPSIKRNKNNIPQIENNNLIEVNKDLNNLSSSKAELNCISSDNINCSAGPKIEKKYYSQQSYVFFDNDIEELWKYQNGQFSGEEGKRQFEISMLCSDPIRYNQYKKLKQIIN